MKSVLSMALCAGIGFSGAMLVGAGRGDEPEKREPIAMDAVPAAVKRSIESHAPGATLAHAWKLTENGVAFYVVNGHAREGDKIEFRTVESGRVVEVMHDIPPDRVPADIAEQVRTLVPKGEIVMADRRSAIRWRITVKDGDKTREVVLRADGKHAVMDAEPRPSKAADGKPAGK